MVINLFLSQCDDVGLLIRDKKTDQWETLIRKDLQGIATTQKRQKIALLRQQIEQAANALQEDIRALDNLRDQVRGLEKESGQISASIAETKSTIAERGFRSDTLPSAEQVSLVQQKLDQEKRSSEQKAADLAKIQKALMETQQALSLRTQELTSKTTLRQTCLSTWTRFSMKCEAAGVAIINISDSLSARRSTLDKDLVLLDGAEQTRQELLQLSRFEELRNQVKTLQEQSASVTKEMADSAKQQSHIQGWCSKLDELFSEVSKQQVSVVGSHLTLLEPAIQEIYGRLNPHPLFRDIKIRIDDTKRELSIQAEGEPTPQYPRRVAVQPRHFFSDAQLNVLAISVFLAGALSQRWSDLQTVFIDDPIQQMDEMNVCAFLDLIRGLKDTRQFIIFTCSREFYLLALDKLSCLNKSKQDSFLAYRLEGDVQSALKIYCDTSSDNGSAVSSKGSQ